MSLTSCRTMALVTVIAASCLGAPAPSRAAEKAHVHGVAKLDIAVDGTTLSIALDSPLDNLVGFERAPRTAAERKQVDAAVARLKAADTMFQIDPAAACKPSRVELSSAVLKLGKPDPADEKSGHADLDGSFEFTCTDAAKAAYVDVGLFAFSHLQALQVQVATPRGQFRRDLKRPARRIVLVK